MTRDLDVAPPGPPAPDRGERERLQRSLREALGELGDLFAGLVQTAEEKAFLRCPYMNVRRECTAKFECRNQDFSEKGKRARCTGLHKIQFCCGGAGAESQAPGQLR